MEENTSEQWKALTAKLGEMFDMEINLESILFLIGLRELGSNGQRDFSKEEKTDLMHIAMCKLTSQAGYYKLTHLDQDGWPHWELLKPLPASTPAQQTRFLQLLILEYFEEVWGEAEK